MAWFITIEKIYIDLKVKLSSSKDLIYKNSFWELWLLRECIIFQHIRELFHVLNEIYTNTSEDSDDYKFLQDISESEYFYHHGWFLCIIFPVII